MKKLSLLMLAMLVIGTTYSQEKTKQKEAGVLFRNFNNFGLTYRFGHTAAMWRIDFLSLNGQNSLARVNDDPTVRSNSFSGRIDFGREWRKPVGKMLEFRYGADVFYGLNWSENYLYNQTDDVWEFTSSSITHRFGMNLVLGMNLVIKEHLVIGAEFLPALSYNHSIQDFSSSPDTPNQVQFEDNLGFNLSSNTALLSLAYRF